MEGNSIFIYIYQIFYYHLLDSSMSFVWLNCLYVLHQLHYHNLYLIFRFCPEVEENGGAEDAGDRGGGQEPRVNGPNILTAVQISLVQSH